MKYKTEIMREIWPESSIPTGWYEVGPDRDCLGLVEIREKDQDGKILFRMSFNPELARQIADAMESSAWEIENEKAS